MKKLIEEIFQKYHMDVYSYLYSLTHDAVLSEDLTSEVFVDVVRSIASFRGESDIRTWLLTIARRRWIDHLRKKKREVPTESIFGLQDRFPVPAASDTDELMQILHRILSREPERTQRIVEMRMEGYSYFEIGKALGISENSARVLFFRIKSKIKEYFEKEGILVD